MDATEQHKTNKKEIVRGYFFCVILPKSAQLGTGSSVSFRDVARIFSQEIRLEKSEIVQRKNPVA
ncbi:MAG: hypothetical protein PHW41_09980, partial [Eubacteriales bacterium]|nr:hypothetical protein [Eubacteriales bacterium]